MREPRSWRTWQLAAVAGAALVVGMGINAWAGNSKSPSANQAGYKLPADSGGSTTTTPASSTTTTARGGATTTTRAGAGATTTSAPGTTTTVAGAATGSTTSTTAPSGPTTVLLAPMQSSGNGTTAPFTVRAGTWSIGWAFQCTPAPASGPAFVVFVVPSGGTAGATPAVSQSGASGQSVTPQTTAGTQTLQIQAPAGCRWAVKVTGYG